MTSIAEVHVNVEVNELVEDALNNNSNKDGDAIQVKTIKNNLDDATAEGAVGKTSATISTGARGSSPSRRSSTTAASAFSESQMEELRASFDECDKGKTGFISVGDLQSVVRTLGFSYGPEAIREMIDRFDLKRSGEIDFEEFVEMMAITADKESGGDGVDGAEGRRASRATETDDINEEEEIRQIFRVSAICSGFACFLVYLSSVFPYFFLPLLFYPFIFFHLIY